MERSETVFDTWFNNTSKMMNDWKAAAGNGTHDQSRMWEGMSKMQQQWMDGYQAVLKNMSSFMPGASFQPFMHNTTQEAFSNMLKSMDIYTNLFQLWQPVFRQMQQSTFNPQDVWKMIDPAEFRSFVDKLFGMDQGKMMQGFVEQYAQIMKTNTDAMNHATKTFSQNFGNNNPFLTAFSGMNPQTATNWYTDMMRTTQRNFAPFFGQTVDGTSSAGIPSTETIELLGNYMKKVNEMQNLLYRTSISAWEQVVKTMTDRTAEGKTMNSFDEFYNEWSAINEREYVALFNTEEFAALQGELLKLQTEVARTYEKQMESFLQPYPVVLRSQLDEVHKTNHELRSKINDLERMIAEMRNTMATAATAAENTKAAKKG